MNRRLFLGGVLGCAILGEAQSGSTDVESEDWTCPMDPQVHEAGPGKCPRCGMTLVLRVPDRNEFPMEVELVPKAIHAGEFALIRLHVHDPNGSAVRQFEVVHEKLVHLFLVNEDLKFFAHLHPEAKADGTFELAVRLPDAGMYRVLADFYPRGSVPQLALNTFYVSGSAQKPQFELRRRSQQSANLEAALRLEPEEPIAGLLTRLYYDLRPSEGLEPYLGAMAHMLVASEDLVDLMHVHPVLTREGTVQFDIIFPRAGRYKIWTQFQRNSVVNTVDFAIEVKDL